MYTEVLLEEIIFFKCYTVATFFFLCQTSKINFSHFTVSLMKKNNKKKSQKSLALFTPC
jgi:predicted membrane protein